jgi:hypothetical protein
MKPSDEPIVITTIVAGGQSKSLVHHHGCVGEVPERLTALEDAIDRTAQTARWFKQ